MCGSVNFFSRLLIFIHVYFISQEIYWFWVSKNHVFIFMHVSFSFDFFVYENLTLFEVNDTCSTVSFENSLRLFTVYFNNFFLGSSLLLLSMLLIVSNWLGFIAHS
jgi:hypothetical protein